MLEALLMGTAVVTAMYPLTVYADYEWQDDLLRGVKLGRRYSASTVRARFAARCWEFSYQDVHPMQELLLVKA